MKQLTHLLLNSAGIMALVIMVPATARAGSRTLSLPSYRANPGSILEVPLSLDNAAGLAAIRVQINFNPDVLELQTVTAGPLGETFDLSQGNGDGFVQLVFVRAEALVGGTGRLAVLRFRANAGAVADLYSELAIADLSLSDGTGVIDLRQKDTLSTTNGHVAVTMQQNIDNAGSGLPDWWEQEHGLDLFTTNANLDPDYDGLPNLLEYAFGGDPSTPDVKERLPHAARVDVGGEPYLSLSFHRLKADTLLQYSVEESTDLVTWQQLSLASSMVGPPVDQGDGTDLLTVRASAPLSAGNSRFMRVMVTPLSP